MDAAGILELGEFCRTFLEHLLLNNAALLTVSLIDLFQDISLMILLGESFTHLLFFSFGLSACDFIIDNLFFVLDLPLFFFALHLLCADGLRTIFINLFHQVDASLVLLAPLVLLEFPLLLALKPCQVLDELLLGLLILSLLKVELLKVDDLLASSCLLLLFKSLYFLFAVDGLSEHVLIALSLSSKLVLLKNLLGIVVTEKLQVALFVEKVSLALNFALLFLLTLPLLLEHLALHIGQLALLLLNLDAGVLLPV